MMNSEHYILGYSDRELKRLVFQSRMLDSITRRMLISAGISPGMHILDIGCGPGMTSQLSAELVGPTGSVTGIEQDPKSVKIARQLAYQNNLHNITFQCSRLEDFASKNKFDIVLARFVLIHQKDAVSFLKKAALLVKSGGYIALHEADNARQPQSKPKVPLWDNVIETFIQHLKKICPEYDIGQRFVALFAECGLPVPELSFEVHLAGGKPCDLCNWVVETLSSFVSYASHTVLVDGSPVDLSTLANELQKQIHTSTSQVEFLGQCCAWAKIA